MVDDARAKVARFINAPKPETVIFTRNATEAINLAAYAWGRKFIGPRDEILLTEVEHHSNLVPWQILAQEKGARLRFVPVEADGSISLETARRTITPKTKLFAFTAASNATGALSPVRELVDLAHQNGAVAFVDGAQWVPHMKTDVAAFAGVQVASQIPPPISRRSTATSFVEKLAWAEPPFAAVTALPQSSTICAWIRVAAPACRADWLSGWRSTGIT